MALFRFFMLRMLEILLNVGIALGFTFAAILLLRPVTNRILRPKYRVTFWMVAWVLGWLWSLYDLVGLIHLLPVTFRGWITPRYVRDHVYAAYVPELTPGELTFALPGGVEIPFSVTEGMLNVLAVLVLIGFVGIIWWSTRQENKIKRLSARAEPMSEEWRRAHGIDSEGISVRIAEDLPASFVCRAGIESYRICLQKDLPEEQMELVLRHEMAHIKGKHVWFKGILMAMTCFYWWNPICWAAYRLACRDMELACDEAVLNGLDDNQRRAYARTLVELGSGKHLWGGLTCFGECDAEIRVRRTVRWKKEGWWVKFLTWPVLILAFLFFFTTPNGTAAARADAWEEFVAEELAEEFYDSIVATGEIVKVRVSYGPVSHTLLIHTDDGRWYRCGATWQYDRQVYGLTSRRLVENLEAYKDFVPLEGWQTGG